MAQQLKTDWVLFLTVVLMVCFGFVMVYSASSVMAEIRFQDSNRFILRQLGFAVGAFVLLMFFKRKNYRVLSAPVWAFAPLGIVLVLLVIAYLRDPKAHRWLNIWGFGIQPSEFAKPALAVFLAWFVTRRKHAINTLYTLLPAALALSVLAGSVIVADLGTAAMLLAAAAAVFYVAGLQKRYFLIAAGAFTMVILAAILSKPYRILRIMGYVDSEHRIISLIDRYGWLQSQANKSAAARDVGYQVHQSKIAVGSGGALGLGIMEGKQKLLFLPEAHNDFIYAVVSEELGLWGASLVLVGFVLVFWRGVRLYFLASDDFGRYLALGISVMLICQAFTHMSVVLDLVPNKGIPLPMISYGGSSVLSSLTSLGILMSVSDHAG